MKENLLLLLALSASACAQAGSGEPLPEPVTSEFELGTATTVAEDGALVTEVQDQTGEVVAHVDWDLETREGLMSIDGESIVVTSADDELTPPKANLFAYDAWSRTRTEVPYDWQCGVSYSYCETCVWCSNCFVSSYGYDCITIGDMCTLNSDCRYADGF